MIKNNKKLVIAIGVGIAVALLIIIIFIITDEETEKEKLKQSPFYTEAFFFKGNEENFSLYNDQGEKVIDQEFTTYNQFICHNSLVTNTDGKKLLVSEKGKIVIDADKYKGLSEIGGSYIAKTDDSDILLDCEGKRYLKLKGYEVNSKDKASTSFTIYDKDTVYIYNYRGKLISKLPFEDADSIVVNEFGDYTIVNSGGESVLYNSITGKVIKKFAEKDSYCINGVDEEGKYFTLNSCNKDSKSKDKKYLVIANKKVKDLSDKCESLLMQNNLLNCVKDDNTYILNDKLEKSFDFYNDKVAYIDGNNYALSKDDKVLIYKDGKKVKEIELDGYILRTSKVEGDMYLLYKDDNYDYYNIKGKKEFSIKADLASPMTALGIALIEDKNAYIINNKGKKVSDDYDDIYNDSRYLKVEHKEKYGLIDKSGKEIVAIKYDDLYKREIRASIYYTLIKDEKLSVYSIDDEKIILEDLDKVNYYDHYMVIEKDNKEIYYTYNGENFYTIKNTD